MHRYAHRPGPQQLEFLTLPQESRAGTDDNAELLQAEARIAALEAALAESRAMQAIAEASMRFLQQELANLRTMPGGGAEALKREIIKIAHPDKWSQGQPATELAHEITVVLTKTGKPRR